MLRLLTTQRCTFCEPTKSLANAALAAGEMYQKEIITRNTAETKKAAQLGLGLPVLVRDDGAMSKDAKAWKGAPKRKGKDANEDTHLEGVAGRISAEHQDIADQIGGSDHGGNEALSAIR